ncbi:MAG: hypothetical protein L3J28_09540 [Candidatus Polarisedimenticolaceae bacterium]|nr:hypothetical protein [Candidatus Polarisedimenticolaceae bacterium]
MSGLLRQMSWLLVALLIVSSVSADDEMGRLFSTPADRQVLDRLRSGLEQSKTRLDVGAGMVGEVLLPSSEPFYLNGLVQRSDGRTTVWVNGERIDQQSGTDELKLRSRADRKSRVKLRLNEEQRNVVLKPGQAWDPASQQIIERYRVKRRAPQVPSEQPSALMKETLDAVMMELP